LNFRTGVSPGSEFQISANRAAGQLAASFASAASLLNRSEWRVGMPIEKTAQCLDRGCAVAALEKNFGKRQLRMREMRGVELDRDFQVLLGQIRFVQVEIGEPELRIG
jgi:hypothetical protein